MHYESKNLWFGKNRKKLLSVISLVYYMTGVHKARQLADTRQHTSIDFNGAALLYKSC